jgi:hypothetical protein
VLVKLLPRSRRPLIIASEDLPECIEDLSLQVNLLSKTDLLPNNCTIFRKEKYQVKMISTLTMLMSMGILFPLLACVIFLAVFFETYYEQLDMLQILLRAEKMGPTTLNLQLREDTNDFGNVFNWKLLLLLGTVSLFIYSYVLFDSYGYNYGLKPATIVATVFFLTLMFLIILNCMYPFPKKTIYSLFDKFNQLINDCLTKIASRFREMSSSSHERRRNSNDVEMKEVDNKARRNDPIPIINPLQQQRSEEIDNQHGQEL